MQFLGYKLKELREQKGLSMLDVAEITGISQSTLSDIENEKKNPRKATVERLCKGLKVDERYFYLEDSSLPINLLPDMPNDIKKFLLDANNIPYLVISEQAKRGGIPADLLQAIIDTMINHKKQ